MSKQLNEKTKSTKQKLKKINRAENKQIKN